MMNTIAAMPREKKPPTVTVRLNKELARQLRIVAAAHEEDVSDYLSGILRPILAKEIQRLGKKLSAPDAGE